MEGSLFRSFWMAGFEAASHVNRFGERIDMIAGTQHERCALEDYCMLRSHGFQTVRDALRWHLVDRGASLDFSSFLPMLHASRKSGMQVIWSLHHYGIPDGIDIFSGEFVKRFVRYAKAVGRIIRDTSDDVPFYTPVNEISFFSWAGSRNCMQPFAESRDAELKRQLVIATIEACRALREIDPRCRFVHVDPIIHVVEPPDRPDLIHEAQRLHEAQYEGWDMLAGLAAPELGGSKELLDIVGMNFYYSNQWEYGGQRIHWHEEPRDPRWKPLNRMISDVWHRYQCPLFLGETSHIGEGRGPWIVEVAKETAIAMAAGVPVEGICLFPILDRYDWEDPLHWHNSGLFDLMSNHGMLRRVINEHYAQGLNTARKILPL